MRELRVQHRGRPYRVLYAFDPRRVAMLLIGGDKTGDDGWYDRYVPIPDKIYDEHLISIDKEGSKDAKSFKALRERMTPEAQTRSRDKDTLMMKDMALHELRSARFNSGQLGRTA